MEKAGRRRKGRNKGRKRRRVKEKGGVQNPLPASGFLEELMPERIGGYVWWAG